jgi:hypothetical protein
LVDLHRQDREERDTGLQRPPFTLPLFDQLPGPTPGSIAKRRRRTPSSPQQFALHIYWSASLEGHALGAVAGETTKPDEQSALRELQTLEYELKEAAARLLHTVWQLRMPSSGPDEDGQAAWAA